jgi:hypothetical protein
MKSYYSYDIKVSTRGHKKYDVYRRGEYVLSFGDRRYAQYKDRIGHYSGKDHGDAKRLAAYYKRHATDYPKYSADWFSKHFLW